MSAEVERLRAEVERLDHLHRLDHSLADQREAELELWRREAPEASVVVVEAVERLAGLPDGPEQLARMITVRDHELTLWRSVFGPEPPEGLAHLAGCMYCVPVCGHEEERCSDYDALPTVEAARMGYEAARRAIVQD